MDNQKYSSHELSVDKNSYHWALELAGATVHAFKEFGSYQGDWLAKVTYDGKTGWIKDYYGSCTGCDSFEAESAFEDRTKREWKIFAKQFSQTYLDDIRTFEEVLEMCSEEIDWDMDAVEMVKWLKENE